MSSNVIILEKVKYHLRELSKSLDDDYNSTFSQFVITNDLDEKQVNIYLNQFKTQKSPPLETSLYPLCTNPENNEINTLDEMGENTMSYQEDELDKIKFHVRLLCNALDTYDTGFTKMVISNNYSEEQVRLISHIFSDYMGNPYPDWKQFELDLHSYTDDTEKLVDQMYDSGCWKRVCANYKSHAKNMLNGVKM